MIRFDVRICSYLFYVGFFALILAVASCTPPPQPIVTSSGDAGSDASSPDDADSPPPPQSDNNTDEDEPCTGLGCDQTVDEDTGGDEGSDDAGTTNGNSMDTNGGSPEDAGSGDDQDVEEATDPCDPSPCPMDATCTVVGEIAECECPPGQRLEGDHCVPDGPTSCAEVDCSGHCAQCEIINGIAQCTCPEDFEFDGQDCSLSIDPCDPNPCDTATQVCVPEAHCQPYGICMSRCDCSNCPNCEISDFTTTVQQYCGGGQSGPATMECNDPCPPGEGCLPYNEPFCWPMQGCFSM